MRGVRKIKRMINIGFTVCKVMFGGLERGRSPLLKEEVYYTSASAHCSAE